MPMTDAREDLPSDLRRRERMARDQLRECADARVVAAMAGLPRHWFLPIGMAGHAYDDSAVAIGCGQTISQPRVVAMMLAALRLAPGMRALDVGAGSGYATVLIDRLVSPGGCVVAIERQGSLVTETAARIAELAPRSRLVLGDGLEGFPQSAPYDAIHVACACETMPDALVAQLSIGGRMILPLGPHAGTQELTLVTRTTAASERATISPVLFVPGLPGVIDDVS